MVELLVACAVLALMLILFGQMAGSVVNSYRGGKARSESNAVGRALFDALDRDIKQIITRDELLTFEQADDAAQSSLKFYSARPGVFAPSGTTVSGLNALRSSSVVEYVFYRASDKQGYLARRDRGATWSNSSTVIPLGTTNAIANLNPSSEELRLYRGVLGFDWRFLRADGSVDKDVTDPKAISALRFTVAVIDEEGLRVLKQSGQLNAMMGLFSGSEGMLGWERSLRDAASGFPKPAVQGVRFYERFIKMPQSS